MTSPAETLQPRIIAWLRKKIRGRASLRGNGLVERIARDLGCDRTDALRALRQLREEQLLLCQDWMDRDGPQSSVTLNLPQQLSEAASLWQQLLQQADSGGGALAALQPLGDVLDGLDGTAMAQLLGGLIALRRDQHSLAGTPRFEVSARYLLASSKLLDALPSAALQQFGIDISAFPEFPGYVMVAGPAQPDTVVLVENPHSFEAAIAATASAPVAWICTYGYGLSLRHSQHGEQLAAIISQQRRPGTLIRAGTPPDWAQLLQHPQLHFWGDLDLAGLDIFERLRTGLPGLTLSGLYRPMLEALERGEGHPYCKATGKPGQQDAGYGEDIAPLAALCRQRAVDQERVTSAQIAEFCQQRLLDEAGPAAN